MLCQIARLGTLRSIYLRLENGALDLYIFSLNMEMGALAEPYLFTLNLESGAPELYNFTLNLEMGAPQPYIFTLNLKNGAPELYNFTLNLEIGALSHIFSR